MKKVLRKRAIEEKTPTPPRTQSGESSADKHRRHARESARRKAQRFQDLKDANVALRTEKQQLEEEKQRLTGQNQAFAFHVSANSDRRIRRSPPALPLDRN